jgi:hypothetical protein
MKFVSEEVIDKVVAALEANDNYETEMESIRETQPTILAYLLSENFEVLTMGEKEYLLYLTLVIVNAAEHVNPGLPLVDQDALGEAEEENYGLLNASKERRFRDKLNVFFEDTPQEDLLAFAEDAIVLDDENEEEGEENFNVTKEGREPIFIALKSVIDVLEESVI